MKKVLLSLFLCVAVVAASRASLAGPCKFSDVNKLNDHLDKHITYPAKGKDIKAACVKEIPDEFSKAERGCVVKKLKDDKEYKDANEVREALGLKAEKK
jgi:hypothetical protein